MRMVGKEVMSYRQRTLMEVDVDHVEFDFLESIVVPANV